MSTEESGGVPWRSEPTVGQEAMPEAAAMAGQEISRRATAAAETSRAPGEPSSSCGCENCGDRRTQSEEFVYALGKLDVRYPSIGFEREFQQRSAQLRTDATSPRGVRLRHVLESNGHLARRMCYLLMIGGTPAYVIAPAGSYMFPEVMNAVAGVGQEDTWCLIIGRRGSINSPGSCGGIVAPVVVCDQLYAFSGADWYHSLEDRLEPVFAAKRVTRKDFGPMALELFSQVVQSTENLGASDAHRAVNYLLMQHPGLFLAAAERVGKQRLDRIDTRTIHGLGLRRLVGVIATFVDPVTGVAERLFTRVDVTEEWPFVSDTSEGRPAPLGLLPFVDNALVGAMS